MLSSNYRILLFVEGEAARRGTNKGMLRVACAVLRVSEKEGGDGAKVGWKPAIRPLLPAFFWAGRVWASWTWIIGVWEQWGEGNSRDNEAAQTTPSTACRRLPPLGVVGGRARLARLRLGRGDGRLGLRGGSGALRKPTPAEPVGEYSRLYKERDAAPALQPRTAKKVLHTI